jgi:hypothetical protein
MHRAFANMSYIAAHITCTLAPPPLHDGGTHRVRNVEAVDQIQLHEHAQARSARVVFAQGKVYKLETEIREKENNRY